VGLVKGKSAIGIARKYSGRTRNFTRGISRPTTITFHLSCWMKRWRGHVSGIKRAWMNVSLTGRRRNRSRGGNALESWVHAKAFHIGLSRLVLLVPVETSSNSVGRLRKLAFMNSLKNFLRSKNSQRGNPVNFGYNLRKSRAKNVDSYREMFGLSRRGSRVRVPSTPPAYEKARQKRAFFILQREIKGFCRID